MKSLHGIRAVVVALAAIVSMCCYESKVPLDATATMELDARLFGSWRCVASPAEVEGEAVTYIVEKARARVYGVTYLEKDRKPGRYEGHRSTVSGVTVINLRDLDAGPEARRWTFARYSVPEPDIVHLQVLSDRLLKDFVAPTPAALRARVESLARDPLLYMDYCVCVRVKPREPAAF